MSEHAPLDRSQHNFSGPDITVFRQEQEEVDFEDRSENSEILSLT